MLQSAVTNGVTTTYAYDADDSRAKKSGNGSTTYFLHGAGGELVTEWKAPGTGNGTVHLRRRRRAGHEDRREWHGVHLRVRCGRLRTITTSGNQVTRITYEPGSDNRQTTSNAS